MLHLSLLSPFWPLCSLDNYTAPGLGIIWRRLGPSNGSSQTVYLPRHLHDTDPVIPDQHYSAGQCMMLVESPWMTWRWSWDGQSSSFLGFRWLKGQKAVKTKVLFRVLGYNQFFRAAHYSKVWTVSWRPFTSFLTPSPQGAAFDLP